MDIDKRHAKLLGSACNITVNVSMIACLDALLKLLNCLFSELFCNAVLYHVIEVPVKHLVEIDRSNTNGMVSNNCVTPELLCKHQLSCSYVYTDEYFGYVLALYVYSA